MIYDGILIVAIWVLTIIALVTITGDAVVGAWLRTLLFLELYAFFAYFWTQRGQTLGMLAWRLRVVGPAGSISFNQALLRFFGGMLSLACLGLGHVWMLFDRERRTWPDMLSKTRIVRVAKK